MRDDSSLAVVTQQIEGDLQFIQRNIRDLSTTAQFAHMKELEELHNLAYSNLKEQMGAGKPLSVDPSLVLETYKTISGVRMMVVETKRKAAETLLKARSLIEVPRVSTSTGSNELLVETDVFDEEVSQASVEGGAGLYGNLVDSDADPEM